MPHLIHLVVALVSLVLFVAMALTYQVADMELNPLSKNLIAMGHSMWVIVTGHCAPILFILSTLAALSHLSQHVLISNCC
jgi:hypothetical protein